MKDVIADDQALPWKKELVAPLSPSAGSPQSALPNDLERLCTSRPSLEDDKGGTPTFSPRDQRHIPAAVRRRVFERDQNQCQFVNVETQQKCCATSNLHVHHILAWAKGGKTEPDNLALRCRTHNLYEGEQEFGPWIPDERLTR